MNRILLFIGLTISTCGCSNESAAAQLTQYQKSLLDFVAEAKSMIQLVEPDTDHASFQIRCETLKAKFKTIPPADHYTISTAAWAHIAECIIDDYFYYSRVSGVLYDKRECQEFRLKLRIELDELDNSIKRNQVPRTLRRTTPYAQ